MAPISSRAVHACWSCMRGWRWSVNRFAGDSGPAVRPDNMSTRKSATIRRLPHRSVQEAEVTVAMRFRITALGIVP